MSEVFWILLGVAVAFVLLAAIVLPFLQVLKELYDYFLKDFANTHLIFRNLSPQARSFLQSNFRYYQLLSDRHKRLFEKRVAKFIRLKEFVASGGLEEVSLEMKTLVSAYAVQITFGHPGVYFSHFFKILIYPDAYYSQHTGQHHQGEVNFKGIIVLSWKWLLEGSVDHDDGRNLGLHEMAHALKIVDAIKSDDYDFMDTSVFNEFIRHGREEMIRINEGSESFFRPYAATNDHEFFAVAIENFFERSNLFSQQHPEMYGLLCELLNQDPRQHRNTAAPRF